MGIRMRPGASVRERLRHAAWTLDWRVGGTYVTEGGTGGRNPGGAQCTNVPNELWFQLGIPAVFGDAWEWVGFQDDYREWIPSNRLRHLRAGDAGVWGKSGIAPFGHVDVVLDGSRLPWLGLDQNWPIGSPVHQQLHDRAGLSGVIRVMSIGRS